MITLPLILVSLILTVVTLAQENDIPVLVINGRVTNDVGDPLGGALVQFWHTDENGNYKHPGFNLGGVPLVTDFQYFGTSETDTDGNFDFRTHRPGIYPARPIRHIHYKVWWEGTDVLTSQFYFSDEDDSQPASLQLTFEEENDGTFVANKTIVLDFGLGGSEPITPSQTEGPFYPVVDFFNFDSDLTVVRLGNQTGTTTEGDDDTVEEVSPTAPSSVPVSQTPSISTSNLDTTASPTTSDVSPLTPTADLSAGSPQSTTDGSAGCTAWPSLFIATISIVMIAVNQLN